MKGLIAEDDRGTVAMLTHALTRAGLEVVTARDGAVAWDLLRTQGGLSLAIVDWMMPGLDGLELCRLIRRDPALSTMYVILLTARDARADLVAGLKAGADDYIVKPFDFEELHARVHVGMRVATLQDRLGTQVSELQIARDALDRLANTDGLTELCSRRRWYEVATNELPRSQRYGRPFSLLLIDIDFFKRVNDTFGHAAGDDVLRQFGRLLREETRGGDVLGRVGGEEFAVLLPEITLDAAEQAAARILRQCRAMTVETAAGSVQITCSIGVSEAALTDSTIESIVHRADAALYEAKRQGRDRVVASSHQGVPLTPVPLVD
jgi:diguanylate cyclase (GGDEF)-like protein